VRFTTDCAVRFPKGGGMAELNAGAPVVREFREAVALLTPEEAGTDIGQALHYAAQLLHTHVRPGNDRLVVLVSDGATWKPKGEEAYGEVVQAVNDARGFVFKG
jgi:Mg-chelatase subunit ChlD